MKRSNPHNRLSLVGRTFASITVVADAGNVIHPDGSSHSIWLCKCKCGSEIRVVGSALTSGNTKSCGCLRSIAAKRRSRDDGMRGTRTYRIWQAMLNRCRNPNILGYKSWGGRGIRVCERWRIFDNFLCDMGEAPGGMSIDRIDNDGNYEPCNCRWATPSQQMRNSRVARRITFNGETMCLTEWAARLDIDQASLAERLRKWPIERALTEVKQAR